MQYKKKIQKHDHHISEEESVKEKINKINRMTKPMFISHFD